MLEISRSGSADRRTSDTESRPEIVRQKSSGLAEVKDSLAEVVHRTHSFVGEFVHRTHSIVDASVAGVLDYVHEVLHQKTLSPEMESVLDGLRADLLTDFEDDAHLGLLMEMHRLSQRQTDFSRSHPSWKEVGFEREDPALDLRGGGVLALKNMLFFLTKFPQKSMSMIHKRAQREDGRNYPWAAVGVELTRELAVQFELVTPTGMPAEAPHGAHSKWAFITDKDSFDRLYCCLFLVTDKVFSDLDAKYADFPLVFEEAKSRFAHLLNRSATLDKVEEAVLVQFW